MIHTVTGTITIPQQYFGLGDCIFIQTLLQELAQGSKILYPIEPQFVDGCNRAYHNVLFIDRRLLNINYESREEYKGNNLHIYPIRYADQIQRKPYTHCMKAKYEIYGLDWKIWKRNALWVRDKEREQSLINLVGAIGEYNLINNYFGSDSKFNAQIEINNGLPSINMQTFPGYSLFDWASIVENATNIHVASSSILYLLELLHLKAKEVHLYARKPIEPHFDNVSYLFTKEYILHA